jgi:hypothetical protein
MSAVNPDTRTWCEQRNHPWVTYNPWLDRTWCRCGQRSEAGEQPMDWDAKHGQFHPDDEEGEHRER